jgi:hypothetical protein
MVVRVYLAWDGETPLVRQSELVDGIRQGRAIDRCGVEGIVVDPETERSGRRSPADMSVEGSRWRKAEVWM